MSSSDVAGLAFGVWFTAACFGAIALVVGLTATDIGGHKEQHAFFQIAAWLSFGGLVTFVAMWALVSAVRFFWTSGASQ